MTREEAIETIRMLLSRAEELDGPNLLPDEEEALEMAIEALEQPEIVHRKRRSVIKQEHNKVSDETKEMIDQLWRAQK